MLSIVIVEDDESAVAKLKECLKMYGQVTGQVFHTVVYNTTELFLASYQPPCDIVFLDIEFGGGMDGLTAARKLREIDSHVKLIFVTNMAQFAIKGYEVQAFDYFVKPVTYHKLKMLLDRIRSMRPKSGVFLKINAGKGVKMLSAEDIYYIEVNDHMLAYHTREGVFETRNGNLKDLEKQLASADFARCNVCFLVNLKYCDELSSDHVRVAGDKLKISRSKYKEFRHKLSRVFGE